MVLEVLAVAGPALIQDGGRAGHMHEGVPPGGALVPELLAATNRAAGNPWDAAVIEAYGGLTLVAAQGPALIAIDGRAQVLREGERFSLAAPTERRVRYLALHGGLDVPVALGGRGTLLSARLGGIEGRTLRHGDRLVAGPGGGALASAAISQRTLDPAAPVRVVLGPDLPRFTDEARGVLLSAPFTVLPGSDRVGTRLAGPRLERRDEDTGFSLPMVQGAIEVPASGAPIVLGPDHPTTGGYPVIATVIRADLGQLGARPPGARVQFVAVTVDVARDAWREHLARIRGRAVSAVP
jgi:biotin-dependent carboxylase-like uncharacterized protein